MERLTRRDLVSLLEFLEESYTLTDLDDFAAHLVRKLPGLVGSDLTGYNEVNLRKRRTAFFLEPRIHLHDSVEIVNRHAHEHPLIRYHERTTDGGATKISDVLTQRELHRLGLYNEFFRLLGVAYQMAFTLHRAPDLIVAAALNRARRDFSELDRAVLGALRPHLARTYRDEERLTERGQGLALVIEGSRDRGHRGERHRGGAAHATRAAREPDAGRPRARRASGRAPSITSTLPTPGVAGSVGSQITATLRTDGCGPR